MRTLPIALLVVVALALPLSTACYAPRIESCRGAVEDFSSVDDVRLANISNEVGFEWVGGQAGYVVEAPGLNGTCISVHSELLSGGVVIHTIDTTLVVRDVDGVPTSSRLHHYRFGDSFRVTTLGRTLEVPIPDPSTLRDAGSSDGGFRPDAPRPSDAPLPIDAGTIAEDADVTDGGGEDDAALDDDAG